MGPLRGQKAGDAFGLLGVLLAADLTLVLVDANVDLLHRFACGRQVGGALAPSAALAQKRSCSFARAAQQSRHYRDAVLREPRRQGGLQHAQRKRFWNAGAHSLTIQGAALCKGADFHGGGKLSGNALCQTSGLDKAPNLRAHASLLLGHADLGIGDVATGGLRRRGGYLVCFEVSRKACASRELVLPRRLHGLNYVGGELAPEGDERGAEGKR